MHLGNIYDSVERASLLSVYNDIYEEKDQHIFLSMLCMVTSALGKKSCTSFKSDASKPFHIALLFCVKFPFLPSAATALEPCSIFVLRAEVSHHTRQQGLAYQK